MKRLMGLDIGEKRIGIAVSDPLGWTAQGLESWITRGETADLNHIIELAKQMAVTRFVAGLPRNMNGTDGAMTDKVRVFCGKLEEQSGIRVSYWDERLTTKAARRILIEADVRRDKRKHVIDKLAACLILQSYMDTPQREEM